MGIHIGPVMFFSHFGANVFFSDFFFLGFFWMVCLLFLRGGVPFLVVQREATALGLPDFATKLCFCEARYPSFGKGDPKRETKSIFGGPRFFLTQI